MDINTEITKKDSYIHFKLNGEFPGIEILTGFDKIIESSEKYNIKNILLDIRNFNYDLSNMDSFNIGQYIANTYSEYKLKIACLRKKDKKNDFTETVAINRGAFFKLFNNEKEAIDWLNKY